ncbi:MAG: hypothetical protein JSR58_00975 [Verrucomicrobia bacterium]|nr:hypothetical protein [Verrucomicrobiota bacterium]
MGSPQNVTLHIANTYFEKELKENKPLDIEAALRRSPVYAQLQFLPCLYAKENDGVLVSDLPLPPFHSKVPLHLLPAPENLFAYTKIESWGASLGISAWAQAHGLLYDMPPWDVVRTVNSKAFSYVESPKLAGSALLHSLQEIVEWSRTQKVPHVIKSSFGAAGRGHLHFPCTEKALAGFLRREGLPVIGEPWVKRDLDFSTQWKITDGTIHYLGATICITNTHGHHVANKIGDISIPHLEKQREVSLPILTKISAMGFFGNVGIDAMIYEGKLHPIVEINARKTMGWFALETQKNLFSKHTISVSYVAESNGVNLLPNATSHQQFTSRLIINEHSR